MVVRLVVRLWGPAAAPGLPHRPATLPAMAPAPRPARLVAPDSGGDSALHPEAADVHHAGDRPACEQPHWNLPRVLLEPARRSASDRGHRPALRCGNRDVRISDAAPAPALPRSRAPADQMARIHGH